MAEVVVIGAGLSGTLMAYELLPQLRKDDRLTVVSYAVSLGKTRSLLCYVPTEDIIRSSFHLDGDDADRYRAWTGDGTFRLSVGLEDPTDIIADLEQALS